MSYVHVVITRASSAWKAIVTCMFLGYEALMKYELGGFRQIDKILDCDAKKQKQNAVYLCKCSFTLRTKCPECQHV